MLRKVDLSSTFCNKLSILSFASQLATLHKTCDWSIFPDQKLSKNLTFHLTVLKKQLHSLRTALTREVQKETTEGQQAILFADTKTQC